MSLFAASVREGDLIKTTRPIKTSMMDYAMGNNGGIKVGTRGIITRVYGWNSYEARLDAGLWGTITVRVKASEVRVTRHGGTVKDFETSITRIRAVRIGVLLAILAPLLWFAFNWFIVHHGNKRGFLVAILNGTINGAIDTLGWGLHHPIAAIAYIAFVTLAWRVALR